MMELSAEIEARTNCHVCVIDNSKFLDESNENIVKGKYRRSDSFIIDVVRANKIGGSEYSKPYFSKEETNIIQIDHDGWFSVVHIVIPSKDWFDRQSEDGKNIYNIVYYTDGEYIYKSFKGNSSIVQIEELLEVNKKNTTISLIEKDYISICHLKKCYINLCKQIFEGGAMSPCFSKSKIDSELIYKRDLVWMAINVIKYLTEREQLAEVERYIEVINGCNGLCTENVKYGSTRGVHGCGCH